MSISYQQDRYSEQDDINHVFTYTIDGIEAGQLYVTLDTLEVANVEVEPEYRRQGIATALWEAANDQLGTVYHAYAAHRSDEGAAFADAVGGEEIEECAIAVCYCSAD